MENFFPATKIRDRSGHLRACRAPGATNIDQPERPGGPGIRKMSAEVSTFQGESNMNAATGFVIPAGAGQRIESPAPGRFFNLKLVGAETKQSIMMFEETLPAGTTSLYHLHQDSDEVAWVISGEFTFKIGDEVTVGGPGTCAFMPRDVPHAWKNTGIDTGRVLFIYAPADAGGYIEALAEGTPTDETELRKRCERYRWKVLGPNPL